MKALIVCPINACDVGRMDAWARTHDCWYWKRNHCLEMKKNLAIIMRVCMHLCVFVRIYMCVLCLREWMEICVHSVRS